SIPPLLARRRTSGARLLAARPRFAVDVARVVGDPLQPRHFRIVSTAAARDLYCGPVVSRGRNLLPGVGSGGIRIFSVGDGDSVRRRPVVGRRHSLLDIGASSWRILRNRKTAAALPTTGWIVSSTKRPGLASSRRLPRIPAGWCLTISRNSAP